MKNDANQNVSETELTILNVLWNSQEASIRDITHNIYGNTDTSNYNTVQSLINRLENKGFVGRDRSGFAHKFFAQIKRQDFINRQLTEIADKVCGGSFMPLLTNLVNKAEFTEDQRNQLKRLIDQID